MHSCVRCGKEPIWKGGLRTTHTKTHNHSSNKHQTYNQSRRDHGLHHPTLLCVYHHVASISVQQPQTLYIHGCHADVVSNSKQPSATLMLVFEMGTGHGTACILRGVCTSVLRVHTPWSMHSCTAQAADSPKLAPACCMLDGAE